MQQVAVRRVDLEHAKAGSQGPLRRVGEGAHDARDASLVQLLWHVPLVEGQRAGRVDGRPSALLR